MEHLHDLLHSETDSELELELEMKLMAVDEMEMQDREAGRKGEGEKTHKLFALKSI